MNSGINLGIFDLVGVIMLVLAGTSFVYLLRLDNKFSSSRILMWFFLCVILSSIATILTNIGAIWDWAFAPSQDALLILGGVFLVRFAYDYPSKDQSEEARWAVGIAVVLASAALVYALIFAVRYIANLPGDLIENQAFYLLTPVAIIYVVGVFFRRSIYFSTLPDDSSATENIPTKPSFKSIIRPNNRPAIALRNYGLALATGLIPVIVLLVKSGLPGVIATFLFNFGIVIALTTLMLTYLNYAPEPVEISAKLVGISLVTVLLILGFGGIWVYQTMPDLPEHRLVLIFIMLVLLSSLLIIGIFPLFFRATLLNPLNKLLNGVTAANDGDLNVQVDVLYDDEIGFLTRSFNRMVASTQDLTNMLENRSLLLETEVNQRTEELTRTNVELQQENTEREKAEIVLNQQINYQQALAGCSQALLVPADNKDDQKSVLNHALEHLRSGAEASRVYIFRVFEDSELGLCLGIQAEACAPGINVHISNPVNLKLPITFLPENVVNMLAAGEYIGGSTEEVFGTDPSLVEMFLTQKKPLLSLMLFPIFDRDQWWGFVGFDDCISERIWDEREISMLRTASEMIGNTLQRWEIESQLRETLNELENRVYRRTEALNQSVTKLNEEIQQRQLVQNDLEAHLRVEEILAAISTRLLEPTKIRENIAASLEDLAQIMDAGRIFLVEFDLQASNQVRDYVEWHQPDVLPMSEDIVLDFLDSMMGLRDRLRNDETIYIQDTAQSPDDFELNMRPLQARQVQSLVLAPITIDQRVHGVLGCSNLKASTNQVQMNLQALELVTGMIESLWQRENLIQTLEEQIAERTRQLTTFLDMAMLSDQAQDLADILQPTLLSITQIAGCDAAGIHIINERNASLELVAQRGIPLEFLQPLNKVTIDLEFAAWLDETDPYEFLGDLDRGPGFPEPFCFPGFRAFYANRLGTGTKSLGLLSCYRVADQPFSPFQATLLTALGELLGIIMENHRLRGEAEELAVIGERQHLAREIHDAVSQSVYSLSLFARSAIDAQDDDNKAKLLSNLQDIETTALQAMREMRLLLYQLREVDRNEDIAIALETRFKQVENRLGIQANCETNTEIWLPANVQHQVWRILVEALNNTVKHAEATQVQVQFNCLDEYLEVVVQDDGIGFDVDDSSPGMGLKNMRARAEIINGRLDITSEKGQGARVSLKIPVACLDPEEGDEP